jgi:hypothetical protein
MAIDAPNALTNCLYTTVRNLSPNETFFGFLPPHGKRLACGESISVWGDLRDWLNRYTPNQRARRSLENALTSGLLAIVSTPCVVAYDAVHDYSKILTLSAGSLAAADPCWGAYSSTSIVCN